MTQVILANGNILDVETLTLEPHFSMRVADWDAFIELVDLLVPENLAQIQCIKDDQVAAAFTDCELVGTQTINNYTGDMIAHFYLTGMVATANEEYKTAYQIMAGEIQA